MAPLASPQDAGSSALLSIPAAAEWLGIPSDEADSWVRAHGLVRTIEVPGNAGTSRYERVTVRDMLEAMSGSPRPQPKRPSDWISTVEAAEALGIDRTTLDAMVDRAPKDLAGAPTHVGEGKKRKHYRWNKVLIHEWARAYRDWELHRIRKGVRR